MKTVRNLAISARLLMAHPLRTVLSVLAVVIGVAAMTVIVSIGNGMKMEIVDAFREQGTNLVTVKAGKFKQRGGHAHQMSVVTTLLAEDGRAIAKYCPSVVATASGVLRDTKAKSGFRNAQTFAEAMDVEGFAIRNYQIADGRFYTQDEAKAGRLVAVLGPKTAKNLFADHDPIGERISLGRLVFTVVGVTVSKGSDDMGRDQDDIVFVPLEAGMRRLFHVTYVETIYVQGQSEDRLTEVANEITALLRHRHRIAPKKDDDFTVMNSATLMSAAVETTESTTNLVLGVATISMFVAGIGILAVMLMAVRERQWEIGLRRAIGARRRDILIQFLAEAALLSLGGGICGLILGLLTVVACNQFGWARADLSTGAALLACALSIVVGVLFGLYPARKASQMQPIEALNS